ncbi:MAG: cytochrome c biogenesis protein ResB [Candidatus Cryptobacteroides sp.]
MDFPVSFFEFPLNLILAVLWCLAVLILWKGFRNTSLVRFFLSPAATWLSIGLCASGTLVMGLSSDRSLASSWWFVIEVFFLLTVLLFITIRGVRRDGKIRWRFLLNHIGLLLAVGASFWGAPDTETLRIQVYPDEATSACHSLDGARRRLPYEITLRDFRVDYFENGVPSVFEAGLDVDGKDVLLRVNHPYSRTISEDIYLTSYGTDGGREYCILQIVRQPWKPFTAAGIIMMMAGAVLMFLRGPRTGRSQRTSKPEGQ